MFRHDNKGQGSRSGTRPRVIQHLKSSVTRLGPNQVEAKIRNKNHTGTVHSIISKKK